MGQCNDWVVRLNNSPTINRGRCTVVYREQCRWWMMRPRQPMEMMRATGPSTMWSVTENASLWTAWTARLAVSVPGNSRKSSAACNVVVVGPTASLARRVRPHGHWTIFRLSSAMSPTHGQQ